MKDTRGIGRTGRLALAATISTAWVVSTATGAIAAGSISVDPSTGLSDGQIVSVTATGFAAGHPAEVLQCATDSALCDFFDGAQLTVAEDGSVASPLTVRSSFLGMDPTTGQSGFVECVDGCDVVVWSGTGPQDAQSVRAPITFS